MDSYDGSGSFKDFIKPFGEKHAGIGKKIQEFKEKHPETDVAPQSLIALSTEQTQELASSVGKSWLCRGARMLINLAATVYCQVMFGWNGDKFNIWACHTSFMVPFQS